MRITQDTIMPLFGDTHFVHLSCLFFRMRCIAHRLVNFGFEEFVNELDSKELLVLACLMPNYQHDTLILEAYRKGDAAIQLWISEHAPHVLVDIPTEVSGGN